MAATLSRFHQGVPGANHICLLTITGDASYPTGGYAIALTDVGFTRSIDFVASSGLGGGTQAVFDPVTSKVMFFTAAGAEVANLTNVSTKTGQLLVLGV